MDRATMRKRGWSIQSDHSGKQSEGDNEEGTKDDDLGDKEKKALLNSFPVGAAHADEEHHDNDHSPAAKRRKTGDPVLDQLTHGEEPSVNDADAANKDERLQVAKKKLSKWAARLFDPDRPRGLVQAPQTIPLNDEFLTAFGKREKDFDDKLGRKIDIDQDIADENESSDDEEDMGNDTTSTKKGSVEGRKVS